MSVRDDARALRWILWLAWRTLYNRMVARMARRRRTKPGEAEAPRTATPRRRRRGLGIFMAFIVPVALWQGYVLSAMLMTHIAARLDHSAHVVPTMLTLLRLDVPRRAELEQATQLRELIGRDLWLRFLPESERKERIDDLVRRFEADGPSAFHAVECNPLWPVGIWPPGDDSRRFTRVCAWLLTAAASLTLLVTMGIGNQDLGAVEWSMLWTATMPAPTRTLFAAKALEYTVINPLIWGLIMPLLLAMLMASGHGWWSLALAPLGAFAIGLAIAAARVAIETTLRLRWPLARLKNAQAIFTVSGVVLLPLVYGAAIRPEMTAWMVAAMPDAPWELLPTGLPALMGKGGVLALAASLAAGTACALVAVALCARLAARGFVLQEHAVQGRRGVGPASGAWSPFGPLRKDLLLLARDRNYLVQALVVPVAIVAMQLILNRGLLESVLHDFRHAAAFAFGLGAYVLAVAGMQALASEGKALWLLCASPQRLERLMTRKALLWMAIAGAYTVTAMTAAAWSALLPASAPGDALMALLGVGIYAFIAVGIGALATDPLETEPKRRVDPSAVSLTLVLSAMYGYAIYAPSPFAKLAQLALSGLLAFALWQKLRDRLPYLLDPTAAPAPSIDLGDGLIAALAFFVAQGLLGLLLLPLALPLPVLITVAFGAAGLVVASGSLYVFWRMGVPDLLRQVGLRARPGARLAYLRAVLWGLLGAAVGGTVACGYQRLLEAHPQLRPDSGAPSAFGAESGPWLALLAVVAAPLCEEFIFRGLVFGGLRRSLPWGYAALASAAIFALVHPPVAVAPVFCLGLMAAVAYQRSGLLLAAMLTHAGYNAVVLLLASG
jgi:membrane protease YdiL (CAAX protease family)